MSRREYTYIYRVHNDPAFSDLRRAHRKGTKTSRILEETDGKLRVVSNPTAAGTGPDLYLEYVPNPNRTRIDQLNGARLWVGPNRFMRAAINPSQNVQLLLVYQTGTGGITHSRSYNVPFNSTLVQEAMRRYQLAPGDSDIKSGTIRNGLGANSTHSWLYSWLGDNELHGNPGIVVRFKQGTFDRPWLFNRRISFSGFQDAFFEHGVANNDHKAAYGSNAGGVSYIADSGSIASNPGSYGFGLHNAGLAGSTFVRSASEQLLVEISTTPGQMRKYTANTPGNRWPVVSWVTERMAIRSVPLGFGFTKEELIAYPELSAFVTQINADHSAHFSNYGRFASFVHLPLSSFSAVDESDYYSTQSFEHTKPLPAFHRSATSLARLSNSSATNLELRIDGGSFFGAGDLPKDFASQAAMDSRTQPWQLGLRVSLNKMSQRFYGATIGLEEDDVFPAFTPYQSEAPSGVPPAGWRSLDHRYRAVTDSAATSRHPLMPASHAGVIAFDTLGNPVSVSRSGDYLLFGSGEEDGPFEVYFNDVDTVAPNREPLPTTLPPLANFNLVADVLEGLDAPPTWRSVESWFDNRNIVNPEYEVTAGADFEHNPKNISAFVSELREGSVTLYGSGNFWNDTAASDGFPTYLKVTANGLPITSGIVTSVRNIPYANGRGITVSMATPLQFFDIDLDVINRVTLAGATNESEYLYALMKRSGFPGKIYFGRGVSASTPIALRNTLFWTRSPAQGGPGYVTAEELSIYANSTSGSTVSEIKNLLYANMLDFYDLPSGDVLIEPIVPVPNKTIKQLFEQESLIYCVDEYGTWVNDPRLTIQDVTLALDENFAEIEVEGSSNEVFLSMRADKFAPFVQSTTERNYFDKSMPAYKKDSSTVESWFKRDKIGVTMPFGDAYNALANNTEARPWLFLKNAQAPELVIAAKDWFGNMGLEFGSGNIKVTKEEGGNRYVNNHGYLTVKINQFEGNQPVTNLPWKNVILEQLNTLQAPMMSANSWPALTLNSDVVIGIWATATGTVWSKATFRFETKIPQADTASLRIEPHIGKFNDDFVPKWFPELPDRLGELRDRKPRKAKRVSTPYIAAIGSAYAVQKYTTSGSFTGYNAATGKTYTASQLATWLTLREFLATRKVRLAFAGSTHWTPNQFLAIARRPDEGPGGLPLRYDILMVLGPSSAEARVGGEAWVTCDCAYVACYDTVTGDVDYGMPIGWAGVWEDQA
jgi:hypothetical protein